MVPRFAMVPNRAAVVLILLLVACQRTDTTSRILEDEGVPVDQGSLEDENVIDFTSAISIPAPPGVAFTDGPDGQEGLPAFHISLDSNVQRRTDTILPRPFPNDFAITVTVKPNRTHGGVLFSTMSEDDLTMFLGLEILPVKSDGRTTIRFIYFNTYFQLKETVSFNVDDFTKSWMRFALAKEGDAITLHYNCSKKETKVFQKSWGVFVIPGTSLFYLGKAGNNPDHKHFEGSIAELKLHQDPQKAATQCTEDENENPFQGGSGSGEEPTSSEPRTTEGNQGNGGSSEYTTTTVISSKRIPVVVTEFSSETPQKTTDTDLYSETTPSTTEATVERVFTTRAPPLAPTTDASSSEVTEDATGKTTKRNPGGVEGGEPTTPKAPETTTQRDGTTEKPVEETSEKTPQPEPRSTPEAGVISTEKETEKPTMEPALVQTTEETTAEATTQDGLIQITVKAIDSGGNEPTTLRPEKQTTSRGEKGEKGDKGDSIKGDTGDTGPPGSVGDISKLKPEKGQKGEIGEAGPVTTLKVKGKTGDIGPRGSKGEMGISFSGPKGDPGIEGKNGLPGPPGEFGQKGEPGVALPGPRGDSLLSTNARRGLQGFPGPPGPPGPPGKNVTLKEDGSTDEFIPVGRIGFPGLKGMKGDTGIPGIPGPPGPLITVPDADGKVKVITGPTGAEGAEGRKGNKGENGNEGSSGPVGKPGTKGEPGALGITGLEGIPGPKGNQGGIGFPGVRGESIKGLPGPPGPPGPPGEVITIGTTDNGEKDSAAQSVDETAVKAVKGEKGGIGMPGIKGIQGERGENGVKGDTGSTGPAGSQGLDGHVGDKGEPGLDGNEGTSGIEGQKGGKGDRAEKGKRGLEGPPGPPGAPGKDSGNDLTGVFSAVDTVKGAKGDNGSRGATGPKGDTGDVGAQGQRGARGAKGDQGITGLDGKEGKTGEPGPIGLIGDDGVNGLDGVQGPKGELGPKGMSGNPGSPGISVSGNTGRPGSPGPPGLPGPPGDSAQSGLPVSVGGRTGNRGPAEPIGQDKTNTLGIVTFYTQDDMAKGGPFTPEGTIAFVLNSQALFVRHGQGWKSIQYGDKVVEVYNPTPRPSLKTSIKMPRAGITAVSPYLHLVALNEPMSGEMGGISGIDHECWRQARAAGLRGTYRAFLSSYAQGVKTIVRRRDRKLPVANLEGKQLFPSWTSMFNGDEAFNPDIPLLSFNGKNVRQHPNWPLKLIWHGSKKDGTLSGDNCLRWNDKSRSTFSYGAPINGTTSVVEPQKFYCNNPYIVLCVQVGVRRR